MKVLSISCKGVRTLGDRTLRFTTPNGEPISRCVVTGLPATGKTTLLQAIIAAKEDVGAYMPRHMRPEIVAPGASSASIEVEWWLHPTERDASGGEEIVRTKSIFGEGAPVVAEHPKWLRRLFEGKERAPNQGTFEYIAATRSMHQLSGARIPGGPPPAESRSYLVDDPQKYAGLGSWLLDGFAAEASRTAREVREHGIALLGDSFEARIREALRPVLVNKALAGARYGEVVFVGSGEHEYAFAGLSASEREGVLLTLRVLSRNLARSVVLFDEPELHHHPRDHAAVLEHVESLAPDAQFFVATTSPGILSMAQPGEIVTLEPRARS